MPTRPSDPAAGAPDAGDSLCAVREAWAAALGHTDFRDDDDFFVVGGHSLLAARVMARLGKRMGQRFRMRTFFDNPTVCELAAALSARADAQPARDRA